MRPTYFAAILILLTTISPWNAPAAKGQDFSTHATLSVDKDSGTFSSAVATSEPIKSQPGYFRVRVYFYPFVFAADDIASARAGDTDVLDKKASKSSQDPKIHNSYHGVVTVLVDSAFKVWQVDMAMPGHSCTIAPFENDVKAFLQTYRYDGKALRLKSKGSYVCDLKSIGAGDQTYQWDVDVSLPVVAKLARGK